MKCEVPKGIFFFNFKIGFTERSVVKIELSASVYLFPVSSNVNNLNSSGTFIKVKKMIIATIEST